MSVPAVDKIARRGKPPGVSGVGIVGGGVADTPRMMASAMSATATLSSSNMHILVQARPVWEVVQEQPTIP